VDEDGPEREVARLGDVADFAVDLGDHRARERKRTATRSGLSAPATAK
jgi:hypothetical protein